MVNKKLEFEADLVEFAELAKAVAHPARLAILKTLAEKQACTCGEIVEVLPLAQATVSQHLKELKNIGLIRGEIDGAKSCYCIDWARLDHFIGMFGAQLTDLKKHQPNIEYRA